MTAEAASHRRNDVRRESMTLMGLMVLTALAHLAALAMMLILPYVWSFLGWTYTPPEAIEVSLVSLKHTESSMATMDVRTEKAPTPVQPDAPEPVDEVGAAAEEVVADPTPPDPSELTINRDDAPKESSGDPDRRRDLLAQLDSQERSSKRENLLAALGTSESEAGDPDSTTNETINLGGRGLSDPAAARYIDGVKRLVFAKFNPLPQLKEQRPALVAKLRVTFDVNTGKITGWSWQERSGNASWDGAAERAIESVGSVPVPPETVRDLLRNGFIFTFDGEA